jgi:hypothetical protein
MSWEGAFCQDSREEHKTDPVTRWFVGESHTGRKIKIIYVEDEEHVYLKSAYLATDEVQRIFHKYAIPQGE